MSDETKATPVSRSQRFFKLAGMTASVATNYASTKLKNVFRSDAEQQNEVLHRLNGERIAKTLGELKGAAMKIGQMASIGSDILPKELADALTSLQKEAPPMDFSVIAGQIESEFGSPPELLFDHFEEEPFAAASIGQVHRARVDDGREVVVKIQYPGVDTSVDSDLAHLRLALRASGLVNRVHRRALGSVFEEVRARLHEELDYTNEAENVRRFRKHHLGQPYVVVPDVVGERSSKRVLTLTYEPSDHIKTLDDKGYDQETRNLLGTHLFKALASQIFELRAVQADPNPANYGFRPDGTVVLYDFGCVKDIKPEIFEWWTKTLRAAIDEDYDMVEQGLIHLGARNLEGPQLPDGYYKMWRDLFAEPLLQDGPYDFGASSIHERVMKLIPKAMRYLTAFQPPVELVFLDRAVTGTFGNVKTLRTIADLRPALEARLEAVGLPAPA